MELPNFDKKEEELVTSLDKWVYLLKNMHLLDRLPEFLNEGIFQKVFNIAEMSKLTKDERMQYERDLKTKSDYEGGIAFSKMTSRQEGLEEGREKTLIEVAEEMKRDGLSMSMIAKYTKLSIQEIEKI